MSGEGAVTDEEDSEDHRTVISREEIHNKPEVRTVVNEETGEAHTVKINQDLRELTGGNETERELTLQGEFSLTGLEKTEYMVYFYVEDTDSGVRIQFANEQEETEKGYCLGTVNLK